MVGLSCRPSSMYGVEDWRVRVIKLLLQITFTGSDGHAYPFLVKPDDDLRKDSRMMETAGLLNRLFVREPVSRRRNLYIRRYNAFLSFVHKARLQD